jgi:hypothetical protein
MLAALTAAGLLAGCASKSAAYHCNLTGKDFDKCCCTQKEGKFYCNEAQKLIDKCCCTMKEGKM